MTANRLQMALISDLLPAAQPLPADVREEAVEIIAVMLVRLVRPADENDAQEARDESR